MTLTDIVDGTFVHLLSHHVLQKGDQGDETTHHYSRMDFRVLYYVVFVISVLVVVIRLIGVLQVKIIFESALVIGQNLDCFVDHPA